MTSEALTLHCKLKITAGWLDGWIDPSCNKNICTWTFLVTKVKRAADYGTFSFCEYKPYIGESTHGR